RVDHRTDVWSLGVVLFECLTGRRPFEGPSREALFEAILNREPPDLRTLNSQVPRDLYHVVEMALEKSRERRYQTALDLAEDLRRLREHEPILARPVTRWTRLARWAQRNPAVAGLTAAVFLVLAAGLAVAFGLLARVTDERDRADQNATEVSRQAAEL